MIKDLAVSFAGEVFIDEVTIITNKGFIQTITNQVVGIEIFEDVFSNLVTGNISVRESHDFLNLFPLVGEETLRISVRTPGFKDDKAIHREFYIYKMDNRFRAHDNETFYNLQFISKEGLIDLNKKISKTYSGIISDSVKNIVVSSDGLETKKPYNIEPTSNTTKHTSNFWSPLKNINYLCETAINSNGSPSYVFFENKNGLNFVSLESMYEMPVYQQFVWDQYSMDVNPAGGSVRDIEKDYSKILEMHTPETFDYMTRIQNGMYGSRMQFYDLTTKQYVDRPYGAVDDFKKEKHLNPYSLISKTHISRPNAMMLLDMKYYNNFNKYSDVTNVDTVQKRLSLLAAIDANKIQLVVPGRTDYSAGQVISLRVMKNQQLTPMDDPETYLDMMYSGKYIISSINHSINRKKHVCNIELVKESLIKDLDK